MKYPKIKINKDYLKDNVKSVVKLCKDKGKEVAGVTKVFCGEPELAEVYIGGGVNYLADSRIQNLKKLKKLDIPKIMMRIPMLSELDDVVEFSDISFNSELETIKLLSEIAIKKGKVHKIVLMVDLGDLREGYFNHQDLLDDAKEAMNLKGVKIAGLAVNMACFGGVIPVRETMDKLVLLSKDLEDQLGIKLDIVSGGNSATLYLLNEYDIEGMNLLRLGEALILGTEPSLEKQLPGTRNDVFTFEAEVIEVKEKPSVPIGKIGKDAFGNIPEFEDKGIRKRIICGVGKQDIDFDYIFPKDKKLSILGGSSDHLVIDGSDSEKDYKPGDIISFRMEYVSILRAMTSDYVFKEYVEG